MVSGKYITIDYVLERIHMEYDIDVDKDEAVEYAWDVYSRVGDPTILVPKTTTIEVEDYKAILPFDICTTKNMFIRDKNTLVTFRGNSDLTWMKPYVDFGTTIQTGTTYTRDTSVVINADGSESYRKFTLTPDIFLQFPATTYTYTVQGDYIYFPVKEFTMEIFYEAIPVDEEGNPLIPDDAIMLAAYVHYIAYKKILKLWRKGKMTDKVKLDSEKNKMWAMAQATTRNAVSDLGEMESIKNRALRLIPKINEFNNGFRGLSAPEMLNKI